MIQAGSLAGMGMNGVARGRLEEEESRAAGRRRQENVRRRRAWAEHAPRSQSPRPARLTGSQPVKCLAACPCSATDPATCHLCCAPAADTKPIDDSIYSVVVVFR